MDDDRSKWALLAVTRFVLAFVVLAGHLNYLPGNHSWTLIGSVLNQGSAVYGFLVISGYSIAASLERSTKGFYARRVRRIWPTYLVSLSMGVAVAASVTHPLKLATDIYVRPLNWVELLACLTMTQTFLAPALSADGQVWTLAVEWWDYMLAPLFQRMQTWFLTAVLVLSLAAYVRIGAPTNPADSTGGLMFVILAWWWLAGFLFFRHRGKALGYVLLIAPPLMAAEFGWTGVACAIGIIAVAIADRVQIPDELVGFLNWLGDLSYPLYLVHVPVMFAFLLFGVSQPMLIAAASLATAAAILHLVDLPFRRLSKPAVVKLAPS
jgi:peptidoglycan/LPS O-acetylase OafA/YrhL